MRTSTSVHIGLIATVIALMSLTTSPVQAQKEAPPSGQVNYVATPEDGTVTVQVVGYGKNKEAAIRSAEKSVMETLLYRGLPGSKQEDGFIPPNKQEEVKKKHKKYLDELLTEQRYKSFYMVAVPQTDLVKVKKRKYKQIVMQIKVNLRALRKDLEANGVIRKFGL